VENPFSPAHMYYIHIYTVVVWFGGCGGRHTWHVRTAELLSPYTLTVCVCVCVWAWDLYIGVFVCVHWRVPMLLMSTTPTNGFFRTTIRVLSLGQVCGKKNFSSKLYCCTPEKDNLDLLDRRKNHEINFTLLFLSLQWVK